ncbi:MAG: cadherin domain-containing protein, partial [Planctomycetia bacterium]|nr:cadherin domain-containing protein [Planctomycetia bacterium]
HDGKGTTEYYRGHGDWAPIMGTAYNRTVTQWSCGEYPGATNTEDDLSILAGELGYREDDHGDTRETATRLTESERCISGAGIIGRNTDVDLFWFSTTAGEVSLEITVADVGANLDVKVELLRSSGEVLYIYAPSTDMGVSIRETLAAGIYFLRISGDGCGELTSGYSDYGSLGYYSVYGELPHPVETPSTIVTTSLDVVDRHDGLISLREAIQYADSGDTITFDTRFVASGTTIALDMVKYGVLAIDRSISIDAMALYEEENGRPGLTIDAGLSTTDALANGGVVFVADTVSGSVVLSGLTLTGGHTSGYGGGVYSESTVDLTLISCVVSDNVAMNGGGIYVTAGSLTIGETTITGNMAILGGGVFSGLADVVIRNSRLDGNEATGNGGAVYLRRGSLMLTTCEVAGNAAGGHGGGVCVDGIAPVTANGVTMAGNLAGQDGGGGGIWISAGELTLIHTILAKNVARDSGNDLTVDPSVSQVFRNSLVGSEATLFVAIPRTIDTTTTGTDYDAALWNLYPDRNSPSIDAGDASLALDSRGNALIVDLIGATRIQGGEVDIGAYEYVSDPVPSQLTADPLSHTSIRLTWSDVYSATAYQVYRTTSDGTSVQIYSGPLNTFTDTDLPELTTYEYHVYAVLPDGVATTFAAITAMTQEYPWTEGMKQPTRAYTVSENAKSGTRVASLTPFVRATTSRRYDYAIVEGGEYFTINERGVIAVRAGAAIDYETTPTISLTIETCVNGVRTYRDAFTIQVKDVNESPGELGLLTDQGIATTAELTEGASGVGILTAMDPEGSTVTFRLSGTDAKYFTVVQTSEGVELQTKSPLDYENPVDRNRDGVYELTVTATDRGGKNVKETLWIAVTDRWYTPDEMVSISG